MSSLHAMGLAPVSSLVTRCRRQTGPGAALAGHSLVRAP